MGRRGTAASLSFTFRLSMTVTKFLRCTARLFAAALWLVLLAAPISSAPPPVHIAPDELAARRSRVLDAMKEKGGDHALLLLRAPDAARFTREVEYPYRPDNDLVYLSGIDEPGAALLLSVAEVRDLGRALLFLAPHEPSQGPWITGRLTPSAAAARSGLAPRAVLLATTLRDELAKAKPWIPVGPSAEPSKLFFDTGDSFDAGSAPSEPYDFLVESLGSRAFHLRLGLPAFVLHPLRQVKSPAEIERLEWAIRATVEAQRSAWRALRPGIYEYEVRAVVEAAFVREGCRGWSFPPIAGSGPNTCILHYDRYDRQAQAGELFLLDIGAEHAFYSADVTRTVPVSGKFSSRQRSVYEAVLRAQEAAIRAVRPGVSHSAINVAAVREVTAGLKQLGLIREDSEAHRYYLHGVSHGLGLDVHDPMPLQELAPGMVITVEPGIYIPEEGIGVRIEDDVLVTADGCRVLSSALPRTVEEIEAALSTREF